MSAHFATRRAQDRVWCEAYKALFLRFYLRVDAQRRFVSPNYQWAQQAAHLLAGARRATVRHGRRA